MAVSLSGFWDGETGLEEPEGPGPGLDPGRHGCCFFYNIVQTTVACKHLILFPAFASST